MRQLEKYLYDATFKHGKYQGQILFKLNKILKKVRLTSFHDWLSSERMATLKANSPQV